MSLKSHHILITYVETHHSACHAIYFRTKKEYRFKTILGFLNCISKI